MVSHRQLVPLASAVLILVFGLLFRCIEAFAPNSVHSSSIHRISKSSTVSFSPSAPRTIITPIQAGVATDSKKLPIVSGLFPNLFQPRRRLEGIPTVEQDPYAVAARGDWRAYLDNSDNAEAGSGQSSGQVYYFNVVTGVSQWTRPHDFPAVQLTSGEQRQALKLQEQYREQVAEHVEQQAPQNNDSNENWLLSGLLKACSKVSNAAVDASVFAPDRPKTLQVEGTWKAYVDKEQSNAVYYYNTATGESQWKPPTPTFPPIQSSVSKRVVESAPPKRSATLQVASGSSSNEEEAELVGTFGDWRAYFDATDSCLVFYVNTQTGTSQWEAPPNFPAVSLRPSQLAKMAVKRQQVALWEESKTPISWEGIWNAASSAASKILSSSMKLQQQNESSQQQQERSWNPFANANEESDHQSFNLFQSVSSLFQPKGQHIDDVLFYEVKKDFFMPDEEPTQEDNSVTRPLERMTLEEKRLKDSDKRQANLRKNYDSVILDRSPTVSLTALKRGGKHKDWFQYLDD